MPGERTKLVISQDEIADVMIAHVRRKMGWDDDVFLKVTLVSAAEHVSMEVELPEEGTD